MDGFPEPPRDALVAQAETSGHTVLEMGEGLPEKILHHVAVAVCIGMGEGVAGRRHGPAKAAEPARMNAQAVTDIIESEGVGELGEKQAHDMTPWREGAGFLVDAVLCCEPCNEKRRNLLAELGEHRQLGLGWFVIHQADPKWDRPPTTSKSQISMGCL